MGAHLWADRFDGGLEDIFAEIVSAEAPFAAGILACALLFTPI